MKNIIINYINLFGVGFQVSPEYSLKKRKVYDLELKAVLHWKTIIYQYRIIIIEKDSVGNCRSIFRKLIDEQVSTLKEIEQTHMYELGSVYGTIL